MGTFSTRPTDAKCRQLSTRIEKLSKRNHDPTLPSLLFHSLYSVLLSPPTHTHPSLAPLCSSPLAPAVPLPPSFHPERPSKSWPPSCSPRPRETEGHGRADAAVRTR